MEIGVPQLHDFYDFNPDIAVLTNIFEAHLDMFGTREYYNENKVRMFQNHNDKNIAIINKGNDDAYRITQDIKSTRKFFSSKEEIDGAHLKDGKIYYYDEEIMDTKDAKLQGNHNYENIMCAIMIAKELGISNDIIVNTVKEFSGVEHRIEFVRTLNGKDFYNDSKATNITSTQIALNAFKRPVVLLLGGLDRSQSFLELKDYISTTKLVVCYGECKQRIKEEMESMGIKTIVVDTLKEATITANEHSSAGDVILLSPGAASWDQYKCFEDRGNEFKEIVRSF